MDLSGYWFVYVGIPRPTKAPKARNTHVSLSKIKEKRPRRRKKIETPVVAKADAKETRDKIQVRAWATI